MVKRLKKIVFKVYVVCLMMFTLWYGYFMYPLIFGFEGKEAAGVSLKKAVFSGTKEEKVFQQMAAEEVSERKRTNLGYRLIDQPYIQGRFHHIGFTLQKDKANTCIRCHGNAPHTESKEIRAFLNMHSFYLACESCHSAPADGEPPWQFRWYDKNTGKLSGNPRAILEIEDSYKQRQTNRKNPVYGDYGLKISPVTMESGRASLLHSKKDMAMAEEYIAERDQLSADEKTERIKVIHRKMSESPVECKACHRSDEPYLPLADLGYPPTRLGELINSPIVGMLRKYKEFHIPDFMRPAGEREN